jgi:uncharacterized protein (TIGR02466 family)
MEKNFKQAQTFHKEGNLCKAEQIYRAILEKQPKHTDAYYNLGVIMHTLGKLKEAEKYFQKAIELKPDFAEAYNNLGSSLFELGMSNEAEISFRKAIELKPDFAEGYLNLGFALYKLDQPLDAIVNFKKALEFKPNLVIAYIHLGLVMNKLTKFNEAETFFKKAINLKPNDAELYNHLANTVLKIDKIDEAITNYKKAIELKSDFFDSYNNLGVVYYNIKKLEEAEIFFNKALFIRPNDELANTNLGLTLHKLGLLDQAIISFSIAIKSNPKSKKALLGRGKVLFEEKDFESALNDFDIVSTKISRMYALASLYGLGRIDEIYRRIESSLMLDDRNLKIASFSSFISHKENRITANKFCNNPMDFINISNLSSHIENSNSFINEVIQELQGIKTNWSPKMNTTVNGYHSDSKINLFKSPSKKLKELKSIILNELDSYHLKFKKETCSLIQKWPIEKNLYAWHIILKQHGYQIQHNHPLGWLSGVIYLKVTPPLKNNEGAIEFNLNGDTYSDVNSPKLIYQPKFGDIVLFPSSLFHKTIPFSSNSDRIVISFDLKPDLKNQIPVEDYM